MRRFEVFDTGERSH